jgi:formamidopyrimidine-DNA glycosylase
VEPDHEPGKHTHVIFRFSDGQVLCFDDMRKFGYLKVFDTIDLAEKVFEPARLGVEPLEGQFTAFGLGECLRRYPRTAIKTLLLSQRCVVGVGNIYADESLWLAKIRPDRKSGTLSEWEVACLHQSIMDVLVRSINVGGTSFDQYRDTAGGKGGFVKLLQAYGRDGKECGRCRAIIVKTRLGGRGTHWCPECQI